MGQVNAALRLDRIVEGLEPHELAVEHVAAAEAAREVVHYALSRGFRLTFGDVSGGHREVLAGPELERQTDGVEVRGMVSTPMEVPKRRIRDEPQA